jgi:hypothetical protein
MARIKLSELRQPGSELFQDSESFLHELNAQEGDGILGGFMIQITSQIIDSQVSISGANISQTKNVSIVETLLT